MQSEIDKAAAEYRRTQDCPNTWDGESLDRGFKAGAQFILEHEAVKKLKAYIENDQRCDFKYVTSGSLPDGTFIHRDDCTRCEALAAFDKLCAGGGDA